MVSQRNSDVVPKSPKTPSPDLLGILRARIRSGEYPEGAWLPTERELADEFAAPRRLVRRAILQLSQEGLLLCRSRFRPVVTAPPVETVTSAPLQPSPSLHSRLVALIMRHADPAEREASAQQRIFWGLNHRLSQEGYHGIFLDLGTSEGTENQYADREAAHLRYALDQNVAGVIFYPYAYRHNRELVQEVARRMPLVLIDRWIPGIQADFVGVDNFDALYEMTRYLIGLGHRRILFASTGDRINTVQERYSGYRQAMEEAPGGPLPESVVATRIDWVENGWPEFDVFFQRPAKERPTAIACVNDFTAQTATICLEALGLRVPEDVAISGFDDIIPELSGGVGLTTVAQPFEQIGQSAAEVFLVRREAGGSKVLSHVELPAPIIMRASTGAVLAASDGS